MANEIDFYMKKVAELQEQLRIMGQRLGERETELDVMAQQLARYRELLASCREISA